AHPLATASCIPVAVLPFVSVAALDGEAFGAGLTEELIHSLSSSPGLQVVAGISCSQFKSKSEDVRRIGEFLGVQALVAGSVRIEGSRVRVLAQLIDTRSGLNFWSSA